jgi:hypothetical protein
MDQQSSKSDQVSSLHGKDAEKFRMVFERSLRKIGSDNVEPPLSNVIIGLCVALAVAEPKAAPVAGRVWAGSNFSN